MYCGHWKLVILSKNYTEIGLNPGCMCKAIVGFFNPISAKMKKSEEDATDFYFSRTTATLDVIGHGLQHWLLVAL